MITHKENSFDPFIECLMIGHTVLEGNLFYENSKKHRDSYVCDKPNRQKCYHWNLLN